MASLKTLKIRIASVKSTEKIMRALRKPSVIGMLGALAMAGSAIDCASAKNTKPVLINYQKDSGIGMGALGGKLLHSYGYKDKKLENGNWLITGQAKSNLIEDSQSIAIYRAAEIALSESKPYIKIVSVNGKNLAAAMGGATPSATYYGPQISYGTRYVIEVEFDDSPDSTANCATEVLEPSCKTIEVAGAMTQIRPHLNIQNRN